jgi:hypothetical protein
MSAPRRWDPCIYHRGNHAAGFVRDYLAQSDRRVLLVAGGGFDPRSTHICEVMTQVAPGRARGLFLREERPGPHPELVKRAEANCDLLRSWLPDAMIHHIQVLATDNAAVGGRNAVTLVNEVSLDGLTDIFVDVSALSLGVAFPLIRHLLRSVMSAGLGRPKNLHVVVMDEPPTDHAIRSIPGDLPAPIHGFRGGWGLDERSRAATLWMPQLSRGKQAILRQIYQVLRNSQPDTVVCPILPFPAARPRLPDELIEEYAEELQESWQVDARDLIYADEKSPVDLYRTILRIDDARRRVFSAVGGSQIILSPVGSKALSLGALMAALERNFTVMYVEAIGYDVDFDRLSARAAGPEGEFVHLWLHGEAYGSPSGTEGAEA